MKISKENTKDMMGWGVAGLVAGIGYSVFSIWLGQKTDNRELHVETEALIEDIQLFKLFCQLQRYRKVSEVDFVQSVDHADRLVFRLIQLRDKTIDVSVSDRTECFMFFKSTMDHLEKLLKKSKNHKNPKVPVEVHNLYLKIFEILETHWTEIMRITKEVHMFNS